MSIYLQGLTMGLAYVAPIGLQNLFVINTALTQKRRRVFLTALIVIFFDITLGLACFLGVGALMQALPWLQKVILAVGSLIVIWIGIGLLRSKAAMDTSTNVNLPIWKVITSACVVTWFNPQAIIDGTMMLGAFRASLPAGTDAFFIAGFASASVTWFLGISALISLFSARFNDKILTVINKVCGAVIIFYGCKLLWSFVQLMGWSLKRRKKTMNAMENLLTRRSIRKYKPDMLPREIIDRIVEAGTYAPTGKNQQSPIIVAVTNQALRDRMSALNAAVMGTDSDPFYGAPVVLVVLADRSNPNHVYDGSLVMGNLMLAAHALGVGSCWINRARQVFDSEEGKAILRDLGIEGDYEGIGNCILGYADGPAPEAKPRKENYVYYAE